VFLFIIIGLFLYSWIVRPVDGFKQIHENPLDKINKKIDKINQKIDDTKQIIIKNEEKLEKKLEKKLGA